MAKSTGEHESATSADTESNAPQQEAVTSGEARPPSGANLVGGTHYQIPTLAVSAMLVAILAPSVMYSTHLLDPTPAELLIAIGIAVFSAVLSLWVLDITNTLRFRHGWVSKSIWGTAIVSIIGTSVGVYKDAFSEREYPFEGMWELSIHSGIEGKLVDRRAVMLLFSRNSDAYWGYSAARNLAGGLPDTTGDSETSNRVILWAEIDRLDLTTNRLDLSLYGDSGKESIRVSNLTVTPRRTVVSGSSGTGKTVGDYHVELSRPK